MITANRRAAAKMILALAAWSVVAQAADWTQPVEVRHNSRPCVGYRARLSGEFMVIQATHEPGWHTYAIDNKQRADEKLAGRQSLGLEGPTEIKVSQGLEVAGPWYQSAPKDLSKPELLWFTWGFDGQALFVAKVRRTGTGPAQISIGGQACMETTCKKIELAISLPLTAAGAPDIDLKTLVRVR